MTISTHLGQSAGHTVDLLWANVWAKMIFMLPQGNTVMNNLQLHINLVDIVAVLE